LWVVKLWGFSKKLNRKKINSDNAQQKTSKHKQTKPQTMFSRCSKCREMGHNSRGCKRASWEAAEMKISYARVAKVALEANKQRVRAVAQGDASQVGIMTEVIDVRGRDGDVTFMTHDVVTAPVRPVQPVQPVTNVAKKVPNSLVKIQEILFDNSQDLPDGLYKQLMDALVIKG
tara:strand:- start:351 stop:872 length:522 start_codon:yes stop_codon:yes gene_type:complete